MEEISASVTPNGGKQISNARRWAGHHSSSSNSTSIPTGTDIATTWSDLEVGFASRVNVAAGSGSVAGIGSGSVAVIGSGSESVVGSVS